MTEQGIALAGAGVFLMGLYLIPFSINCMMGKPNSPSLFAANLFLGWTFFGWVGCLIYALRSPK